jgi:hypothetical protein
MEGSDSSRDAIGSATHNGVLSERPDIVSLTITSLFQRQVLVSSHSRHI